MATSEQMKALIRSHADGDNSRFYSVAMQMAAQAAKSGHSKLADDLRELIENAKERGFEVTKTFNYTNMSQARCALS